MSDSSRTLLLFFATCLFLLAYASRSAAAYRNYTVGDSLGWYDDLKVPELDYRKWTAGKHFSLGDFLIFNTDTNHSVVQTYNETTYSRCDYDDADADDTTEWSAGDPDFNATAVTVPVPLLKVGPTFFFSGNYDGEQCLHGQHFVINVTQGEGLPPSLNASPESPAPASPGSDEDVPDTIVPSNFNNPADNNVKATSAAKRLQVADVLSVAAAATAAACMVVVEIVLG